jgi:hypothetical protein
VRFSAHVQNGPGVHTVFFTMGTGSFQGVKRPGRVFATIRYSYTSTPPWALGLNRDPVTFYLTRCTSLHLQHCVMYDYSRGARGGAGGLGTALQTGRWNFSSA